MTKMQNLGWRQCHCEASFYCLCEPKAWQSAKGGVATRYSSDEAAISRGKLADRDNYDYQKQSSIKNQLWRWRHRCLSMIA